MARKEIKETKEIVVRTEVICDFCGVHDNSIKPYKGWLTRNLFDGIARAQNDVM